MALPQISCLDDARIHSLPATAYYIADFISPAEEDRLLEKITTAPKPRWKQLAHRRLQTWPSDLQKNTLLESPLPSWLSDPIITRLLSLPRSTTSTDHIFAPSPHQRPNHVLINEYKPGEGIMPHEDGAAYYPVVCTVSLGASLCLDIYDKNDEAGTRTRMARIMQEPRSLLITTDDLYIKYLHGIADIEEDVDLSPDTIANWSLLRAPQEYESGQYQRGTRTSLTYRDVLKVSKLGSKLTMFGRR